MPAYAEMTIDLTLATLLPIRQMGFAYTLPSMRGNFQSNQLPVFESEFVGRQIEIDTILMALETHSLISIVGPGGIGKTRLATQIAQIRTGQFQRGIAFIPLVGITTREALIDKFLAALHIQIERSQDNAIDYAAQFFMDQPMLIIFDGAEQLVEHGEVLSQLAQLNGPKLLLTTGMRTGLPNEFALDLHGLPHTHNPHQPNLRPPAEQLFVQCVRQINPNFEPSDDDFTHIQRICTITDGMPLAIELAASWVRLLPIKFIANQIAQNLDWLTSSLSIASRHTQNSVRIILDRFWQSLSSEEQQQLCQLSVFQDGFECDMAQTLANASRFFLSALAQHSFLTRDRLGRYRVHGLLRQYAHEQLEKSPYDFQTRLRHAELMRDLSQRTKAQFTSPQRETWQARMHTELGNVRQAIAWSLAQQQPSLALELLVNLEALWNSLKNVAEVNDWLERALQMPLHDSEPTQRLRAQAAQLQRRYSTRQPAK